MADNDRAAVEAATQRVNAFLCAVESYGDDEEGNVIASECDSRGGPDNPGYLPLNRDDLRTVLTELERLGRVQQNVAGLLNTLNAAYRERAQLLGLAAVTYPAFITDAVDVAEPGWHLLVLTIDGHQATWHIAPSDMGLWSHVPYVQPDDPRVQWDGHTTEQKYERILDFTVRVGDAAKAARDARPALCPSCGNRFDSSPCKARRCWELGATIAERRAAFLAARDEREAGR